MKKQKTQKDFKQEVLDKYGYDFFDRELFMCNLPPTDNALRIPTIIGKSPRLIPTSAYNAWKKETEELWFEYCKIHKIEMTTPAYTNQYIYEVYIILPNARSDFSNYIKATKDFFEGKLYLCDKWVNISIKLPVLINNESFGMAINIKPREIIND
jgi:hypothetical protein